MKLIPPGTNVTRKDENEMTTQGEQPVKRGRGRPRKNANEFAATATVGNTSTDVAPLRAPLVSLQSLVAVGTHFSEVLENAVTKLQADAQERVDALGALLTETARGIQNIMGGGSVTANGRAGRHASTGVGSGKRGRGRPRKVDSGTADSPVAGDAGGNAPKRGRGRPKGSRNKKSGRGPGRPRKVVSEPAKPAAKSAGKRGRPRKAVAAKRASKPAGKPKRTVAAKPKPVAKRVAPAKPKRVAKPVVKSEGKPKGDSRGGGRKGGGEAPAAQVAEQPAAATE